VFAGLGIALGAFGAHALKSILSAVQAETYETAVRYQMYHAFALLITGISALRFPRVRWFHMAGWLFLAGIIAFSGSLYLYIFSGFFPLVFITPLGGVFFIAGWLTVTAALLKARKYEIETSE